MELHRVTVGCLLISPFKEEEEAHSLVERSRGWVDNLQIFAACPTPTQLRCGTHLGSGHARQLPKCQPRKQHCTASANCMQMLPRVMWLTGAACLQKGSSSEGGRHPSVALRWIHKAAACTATSQSNLCSVALGEWGWWGGARVAIAAPRPAPKGSATLVPPSGPPLVLSTTLGP